MSRTREAICVGIGILAGITLCGPAAQAATEAITAKLSSQPVYVDGQKVEMEAYSIHSNNFVKLRDIGEAVGFNVYYKNGVIQIESDQPYTGKAPASQTTQPTQPEQQTPAVFTEESVEATIQALRDIYPSGTVYGAFYRSESNGPFGRGPDHCAGWATLCSDAAFGDLPWRGVSNPNWDEIRSGDLVRFDGEPSNHVVVVLNKTDDYIMVTESGKDNKALWGGMYFKWWLEEQPGYTLYTRYPQ